MNYKYISEDEIKFVEDWQQALKKAEAISNKQEAKETDSLKRDDFEL